MAAAQERLPEWMELTGEQGFDPELIRQRIAAGAIRAIGGALVAQPGLFTEITVAPFVAVRGGITRPMARRTLEMLADRTLPPGEVATFSGVGVAVRHYPYNYREFTWPPHHLAFSRQVGAILLREGPPASHRRPLEGGCVVLLPNGAIGQEMRVNPGSAATWEEVRPPRGTNVRWIFDAWTEPRSGLGEPVVPVRVNGDTYEDLGTEWCQPLLKAAERAGIDCGTIMGGVYREVEAERGGSAGMA